MTEFSTVLASAVHDMKNSLCLLLQSIETLTEEFGKTHPAATQRLANIHYEASRVNTSLMHILSLYRADMDQLPLNIDEHYVEDVLEDVIATNQMYMDNKGVVLNTNFVPELFWYLDNELVCLLLNDILINSIRYSRHHINISSFVEDNYLCIQLEDDGDGYPEMMLEANNTDMHQLDVSTGRTGLGLYFARMLAMAHARNGRHGTIQMHNGGAFGGGVFTLKLP